MRMPILWKEWHEQRWRLAFGTVMLVGLIGSLAAAHVISNREMFIILCGAGAFVLPLYSAMGVFAPERTAGTFTFYASKPAKPLAVFMAKWFFGWLNVVVPVLVAAVFAMSLSLISDSSPYSAREAVRIMTETIIPVLCFGTILYTMTCCFAPSKSSEAFVGLAGLLILLILTVSPIAFGVLLREEWHIDLNKYPLLMNMLFSLCPLYLLNVFHHTTKWLLLLYLELGTVFLIVLSLGYWKWRRKW
jgi:hypothetical protein